MVSDLSPTRWAQPETAVTTSMPETGWCRADRKQCIASVSSQIQLDVLFCCMTAKRDTITCHGADEKHGRVMQLVTDRCRQASCAMEGEVDTAHVTSDLLLARD